MDRTPPAQIAAATGLAVLAGYVDACAYLNLGGFFASFMSGNTTRLGIGIATATPDDAKMAGALLLSFVAGVIGASVMGQRFARWRMSAVMALATGLILIAAVAAQWAPGGIALLALAAAMGAENGVFSRDGQVSIGVTYFTGTLVRFGQRVADALMGVGPRYGWVRHILLWLGFLGGVIWGAQTYAGQGLAALWYAAAGGGVLTLLLALVGERGDPVAGAASAG